MWYILQTLTGQEKELAQMIRNIVPQHLYQDCFVAYYERIWRKQQRSIVHVERLFPGYVFIVSDKPKELFQQLKRVPAMSKLLSDGSFTFLALEREEELFLETLLGCDRIVQLSYVDTDGRGHVRRVTGPLKSYTAQVVKYQFKKRYALIRLKISGIEKTAVLGIVLNEDLRQEIDYGKVEAPIKLPDVYSVEPFEDDLAIAVGDLVKVTEGTLENMTGVVCNIKKRTVEITVRLFGQDMSIEMPVEDICKTSDKECYGKEL